MSTASSVVGPTASAQLTNGAIQVFVVNTSGQIWSRWKVSSDSNSAWTNWSLFQAIPSGGVAKTIFAVDLSDKRIQLWCIDDHGRIFSCWKTTTVSSSAWTAWSAFSTNGIGNNVPQSMGGSPLSDGRPQIFLTTQSGLVFSCWKTAIASNSSWTAWSAF